MDNNFYVDKYIMNESAMNQLIINFQKVLKLNIIPLIL